MTSSNNTKLPKKLGESVAYDGVQLVPARFKNKNRLYNGAMFIDQRVGPYTLAGTTTTPAGAYTLDQWYVYTQSNVTVSQVSGTLNNSLWLAIQRNSGTGLIKVGQTISMLDCRGTYSQYLAAQLQAFVGANFSAASGVTLTLYGGSGTKDVNNVKTPFTNQQVLAQKTFMPSSTQALYSVVSQLTPQNTTQVSFELSWTPQSTTAGTSDIFYFSLCQLETSPNPTYFEHRHFLEHLYDCQFWFRKSYRLSVKPATASSTPGIILFPSTYAAGLLASGLPSGSYSGSIEYEPMFSSPTVSIYSYGGQKGRMSGAGAGADLAAGSGVATTISEKGFAVMNSSGSQLFATSGGFWLHYTAEAVI